MKGRQAEGTDVLSPLWECDFVQQTTKSFKGFLQENGPAAPDPVWCTLDCAWAVLDLLSIQAGLQESGI